MPRLVSVRIVCVGLLAVALGCAATACGGGAQTRPAASTNTTEPRGAGGDGSPEGPGGLLFPPGGLLFPPGGLLPHGKAPLPGLVTGGQPNTEQLERAARAGVTTVISLRTAGEPGSEQEQTTVERLGMTFVSIPVAGAADLTEEKARELGAALERAGAGPVALHCGSGNRAGALLALKAYYVDRMPPAEALQLGKRAGLSTLEDAVRERLERPFPE